MNNLSINTIAECNTYDELRTFIKREDINIKNLLVGNGYSRAHPIFKNAFKWNLEKALSSTWDNMPIFLQKSQRCPEKDLEKIRYIILRDIIQYYIDSFVDLIPEHNGCHLCNMDNRKYCQIFNRYTEIGKKYSSILFDPNIQTFDNIFTINYDPLLYFDFLLNTSMPYPKYVDGFNGPYIIDQNDIVNRISTLNGGKIIYLHGSWFIISDSSHRLFKFSFSNEFVSDLKNLLKYPLIPYLVLEDRYEAKEMILNSEDSKNSYLKNSFDRIKNLKSENILILGCSFDKDDHILKALINNTDIKNIYFGYVADDYLDRLETKIGDLYKKGVFPRDYSTLHGVRLNKYVIWKSLS